MKEEAKPTEIAPLETVTRPRWIYPERESVERRIALNEKERLELIASIERDTTQMETLHEAQRARNAKGDYADAKSTLDRIDFREANRARAYGALSRNNAQRATLLPYLSEIDLFERRANNESSVA